MADVSERLSDTQEENIYYYVSSTSDSWSNDLDNQQFDKRHKTKKKSVEATIKNKEIEKRLSSTLMQLSLLV